MIYKKIVSKCNELNVELSQHLLFVSIAKEKLYLFENDTLIKIYDVSTSRNPPSCVENSNGTPIGLHKIDGKIGANAPLFTVFRGRIACGLVSEQTQEEQAKNLITTRIMRLRGLEEGKNAGGNVDTYNRYVYIHGTNQEDKIGTPNSHGCVLLRNNEVAELFDVVNDGTIVLISME
ncbi:MAG: L,D-transpeptidase [Verrucomicrobiaceae bacterium]|nr:L,D-transpeptidase [Verrucomicrobiaceae bacterium]